MYPVSASYLSAVREGGQQVVTCDAWRNGFVLPAGKDLLIDSGSVTDDSRPGVRRQLGLELVSQPGLFDLLTPSGTQLKVRSTLYYPNNTTEVVPMGVFEIDSTKIGYGPNGTLSVQASDKWVRIQRHRFLTPYATTPTLTVKAQITALIRRTLGAGEPVNVTASSNALVGNSVFEREADKAIIDMAESIGAWVFFDRDGVATIADVPTAPVPVWEVVAGPRGVMLDAQRARDRSKTYNVVVVNSEKVDGSELFPPQYVWDNDANSPTYAGPGSGAGAVPPDPALAGPFGQVPYFYSSPLLGDAAQAIAAGRTILARVKGLNAQLSLTTVRNHALDALDAVSVVLPAEWPSVPRAEEQHAIDKIVHPLTADSAQDIDTRSTRTDEV